MSNKVVLTYFDGRGRMESIRWLLATAGVEFEEVFLTTKAEYTKLLEDGALLFQQLPLVEINGMKLIQTKAILNYIAEKYNLHGKDPEERVQINMYAWSLVDLMEMIMVLPFQPDAESKLANIQTKAKERYLPVFEKALCGPVHLVGGKVTMADVLLMECSLMLEEKFTGILGDFPNIKSFQGRMGRHPGIKKFLEPGGKRKPQPDDCYCQTVKTVLYS
ncbi:glutathione S-transferase alpha-4-like [Neosynchiropus ocellatus]